MYSDEVMDHFHHPRNLGYVAEPHGQARRENPVCGDVAEMSVRVENGCVVQIGFRAVGCVAALAACSRLTEMVLDLRVEEARALTCEGLTRALGGVPRNKRHAPALAIDTLREALRQIQS